MCFMKSPPPPPPPPAAPPMLEQSAPKLSDASDETSSINARSRGLSRYKIERRSERLSPTNSMTIPTNNSGN